MKRNSSVINWICNTNQSFYYYWRRRIFTIPLWILLFVLAICIGFPCVIIIFFLLALRLLPGKKNNYAVARFIATLTFLVIWETIITLFFPIIIFLQKRTKRKYKEIEYEEEEYRDPKEILGDLEKSEKDINEGIKELIGLKL